MTSGYYNPTIAMYMYVCNSSIDTVSWF